MKATTSRSVTLRIDPKAKQTKISPFSNPLTTPRIERSKIEPIATKPNKISLEDSKRPLKKLLQKLDKRFDGFEVIKKLLFTF